jgi:hypothetical protein
VKYGLLLTFSGLLIFAGACTFDFLEKRQKSASVSEESIHHEHEDIQQ